MLIISYNEKLASKKTSVFTPTHLHTCVNRIEIYTWEPHHLIVYVYMSIEAFVSFLFLGGKGGD